MVDMPPQENNVNSLLYFYNKVGNNIRSLEVLDTSTDTSKTSLIPIILRKLPYEVRMNLTRQNGSDSWNLDTLQKCILK